MKALKDVCLKYNVLLICDEVQSGLGRAGTKSAYYHDLKEHDMKPDIMVLGKALSGAVTPASGIMIDLHVS